MDNVITNKVNTNKGVGECQKNQSLKLASRILKENSSYSKDIRDNDTIITDSLIYLMGDRYVHMINDKDVWIPLLKMVVDSMVNSQCPSIYKPIVWVLPKNDKDIMDKIESNIPSIMSNIRYVDSGLDAVRLPGDEDERLKVGEILAGIILLDLECCSYFRPTGVFNLLNDHHSVPMVNIYRVLPGLDINVRTYKKLFPVNTEDERSTKMESSPLYNSNWVGITDFIK